MDVRLISKEESKSLLEPYHYLSQESVTFRSGYNYGMFLDGELMVVCIFNQPSVPNLVQGCFGLKRDEQQGVFELGRLVKNPESPKSIILSQVVSLCMKQLRRDTEVRAILSYSDSRYHTGYIYQALNFKYYGLTDFKPDFWFELPDGTYKKHSRGPTKGFKGVWLPRPRKHRYLMVYDKKLKTSWIEEPYPKGDNTNYYGEEKCEN